MSRSTGKNPLTKRHSDWFVAKKKKNRKKAVSLDEEKVNSESKVKSTFTTFDGDAFALRWLKSHLNKNWNEVYSEFLNVIGKKSYSRHQVDMYLKYWISFPPEKPYPGALYVDESNILRCEKKRRVRREKKQFIVTIGKKHFYNFQDIWYEVKMHKFKSMDLGEYLQHRDVFRDAKVMNNIFTFRNPQLVFKRYLREEYGDLWCPTEKKSANSRQIAKIKEVLK